MDQPEKPSSEIPEILESSQVASEVEPEIIWEDHSLALVMKPAGWLTVPGMPGSLSSRDPSVQQWLADLWKNPVSGEPGFVGTVHRLDRPVSGVMVWAKNPRSARRLSEQFAAGKVIKQYWAIASGGPESAEGDWEDWLIVQRINGRNSVARCQAGSPGSQLARTNWQIIPSEHLGSGLTWFSLWPQTGRMHQLRVQTSERGWPILGDTQYGCQSDRWQNRWKLALHARSLTFSHPETGENFLAEAAVESHWSSLGNEPKWFSPEERFLIKRS